jgi:hypothetical protein
MVYHHCLKKKFNLLTGIQYHKFPFVDEISKFLNFISKLGYEEKPDYNKYKTLFRDGLKKLGVKDEWKLHLPLGGASAKVLSMYL